MAQAKAAFSKEEILRSKKFSGRRDALSVVLKDDKQYTMEEIQKLLEGFMKGKVR